MRLLLASVLVFGGMGLYLLDSLAHALSDGNRTAYFRKQLQTFPTKENYTRDEVVDAAWQVWTNRVALPLQPSYTVPDLKAAVSRRLLGTSQTSCDRTQFEHAIGTVAGYHHSENGLTVAGVLAVLLGAFLLGGALFPAPAKKREVPAQPTD